VPAQHTTASIGPTSRSTRATASATDRESVASPSTGTAPSGDSLASRSNDATCAPRASSSVPTAWPIPRPPPVTSATFPSNSLI
jgi:hypothetical protein